VTGVDVASQDLTKVRAILLAAIPEYEVRAFGSRTSGTARKFSDLDLVIMTKKPLAMSRMAALSEAFSESDLPFKVDLLDWAATGTAFQRLIERHYAVIQGPAPPSEG
jgi:predicted nucleotidyltransferase